MANSNIKNYPKNVGIIMDGNGRWAIKNSLKISQGHKKGVEIVRNIVEDSVKHEIESLTLYAFSSENWNRPKAEINAIKKLVVEAINDQVEELKEKKVALKFFGHLDEFGKKILDKIKYAENETQTEKNKLNLNIALGHGGQQDIVDVIKKVSQKVISKEIDLNKINVKTVLKNSSVPVDEIDLLIRTGGDQRVSNFLLYQIAYAEIIFIKKYWPDFTSKDYIKCLYDFSKVNRRFGKRLNY